MSMVSGEQPVVIFIHGTAASGKLTVARALADRVGFPVFHNHLAVDLLTSVFPFGSGPFVRLREAIWLEVMDEAMRAGTSLIFTFMPEATVAPGFPARVMATAGEAGGRVHFVRLHVHPEEQGRRVVDPSRREFGKVADTETLARMLAQPAGEEPPVDLEIDTMALMPEQSAVEIAKQFGLRELERG